jgi:hypothetical protein
MIPFGVSRTDLNNAALAAFDSPAEQSKAGGGLVTSAISASGSGQLSPARRARGV